MANVVRKAKKAWKPSEAKSEGPALGDKRDRTLSVPTGTIHRIRDTLNVVVAQLDAADSSLMIATGDCWSEDDAVNIDGIHVAAIKAAVSSARTFVESLEGPIEKALDALNAIEDHHRMEKPGRRVGTPLRECR